MNNNFLDNCYPEEKALYFKLLALQATIKEYGGKPKYPISIVAEPLEKQPDIIRQSGNGVLTKTYTIIKRGRQPKEDSLRSKIISIVDTIGEGTSADILKQVLKKFPELKGDKNIEQKVSDQCSKMYRVAKTLERREESGRLIYMKK